MNVRLHRLPFRARIVGALLAVGLPAAFAALSLAATGPEGAERLRRTTAIQRTAKAVLPPPAEASRDRAAAVHDGCLVGHAAITSPPCVYGDAGSRTTVVLFGDSHAVEYFPALERIARTRHWRLVVLAKAGCAPGRSPAFTASLQAHRPNCATWLRRALRRLRRSEQPAMVVVGGSSKALVWSGEHPLGGAARVAALGEAFARMLGTLEGIARHVVFIEDNPRPPFYAPDCVARSLEHLDRCAFAQAPALAGAAAIRAAAEQVRGVRIVDPTPEYCPRDGLCPAVIGDVLVYRNSGHVTATYAGTMTSWLRRRLPLKGSATAEATTAAGAAPGAERLRRTTAMQRSAHAVRPDPGDADRDAGRAWLEGCQVGPTVVTSPPCVYGDRASPKTVVLFGDSHAMEYFAALEHIARRQHWRLVVLTKAGCAPGRSALYTRSLIAHFPACRTWLRHSLRRMRRSERPAMVVVGGSSKATVWRGRRRLVGARRAAALGVATAHVLRALRRISPRVVFVQDNPRPPFSVPSCVERALEHLRRCAFARDRAIRSGAAVRAAAERADGVEIVDPTREYCPRDGLCPAVIGGVVV
jgi:predicted alpha/beta-fold hydrolase